jgi:DNA-binding NarL/FixJ family response regulator
MKRVYLADAHPDERSALRLLLGDLNLKVVGEAGDWPTALAQAPATRPDMILVDWDLVNHHAVTGLWDLRQACAAMVVIILISHLDAQEQAAQSLGADAFISKSETSERVIERLQFAVAGLQ